MQTPPSHPIPCFASVLAGRRCTSTRFCASTGTPVDTRRDAQAPAINKASRITLKFRVCMGTCEQGRGKEHHCVRRRACCNRLQVSSRARWTVWLARRASLQRCDNRHLRTNIAVARKVTRGSGGGERQGSERHGQGGDGQLVRREGDTKTYQVIHLQQAAHPQ